MTDLTKVKAKLILSDGSEFPGFSFGLEKSSNGEVVFNTAMTGYPESLTDPSYRGQILVLTYPLIGNYGVPTTVLEGQIQKYYESSTVHIRGLIVSDYSYNYSHWNAKGSLAGWLKESGIPALYGIDTRALTKHLRTHGSMPGAIVFDTDEPEFIDPNQQNLVNEVSTTKIEEYGSGQHKVMLVDCGVKNNIIRCLTERDAKVIRVPWDYDFNQDEYDGLFISNGPGDPEKCEATIQNLRKALNNDKPIFGICLGNQLLGLAGGGKTYKLKFGHRSHNQPVLLKGSNTAFITSQNHGFAIDEDSLGEEWETLYTNLNDGTNEGLRHKTKPVFSTQFHPEAAGGPSDTMFLFDHFIEEIKKWKKK